MGFLRQLGLTIPIVQAPMAGASTPDLAAAVSNAGGLGSIGVGATDAAGAHAMIEAIRARTEHAFNVNLFVHSTPRTDQTREKRWVEALRPLFLQYGAEPPAALKTIYTSFADDDDMLGNPTRSYRSSAPLKVIGEIAHWTRLAPEALQVWRERLTALLSNGPGEIIN